MDRNLLGGFCVCLVLVALRKESVDRNYIIKITRTAPRVALRKESVDRNARKIRFVAPDVCRSPQGERG